MCVKQGDALDGTREEVPHKVVTGPGCLAQSYSVSRVPFGSDEGPIVDKTKA